MAFLFSSKKRRRYNSNGGSNSTVKIVLAIMVVATVAIGGWLLYDLNTDAGAQNNDPTNPTSTPGDGPSMLTTVEHVNGGGGSSNNSGGDAQNSQPPQNPQPPAQQRSSAQVSQWINQAAKLHQANELVSARSMYNKALHGQISAYDAAKVMAQMTQINELLVFSPMIAQNDPITSRRPIKPGDLLQRIAFKNDVTWQLLGRLNNIPDPSRLRAGRTIKLVKGPFHAVVHKRAFRMDVFAQSPDGMIYVRSFKVGLGEYDSTPIGKYIVRPRSKLINPNWVNPRTGKRYSGSDPDNPIGKYWLGLQGVDENTQSLDGYGIHGTNQPETIGTMASMGCIRMHADDVKLIYEMLIEKKSTVTIRP